MFDEFNEATQLKTSLAKYSIEFNDLAIQMRPHRIAYLRQLGRPYTSSYTSLHITVCEKVCGQTSWQQLLSMKLYHICYKLANYAYELHALYLCNVWNDFQKIRFLLL